MENVFEKRTQALNRLKNFRTKQNREMDLIIPRLYVGGLKNAQDIDELQRNNIKYIVTLMEFDCDLLFDKVSDNRRLIIKLGDTPQDEILMHVPIINDFIHQARLSGRSVLIHCVVGVSRSISIAGAYLMSITKLGYPAALAFIQARRSIANPNFGFRMQLCKFATNGAKKEYERLRLRCSSTEKFDALFHNDCIYTNSLYCS